MGLIPHHTGHLVPALRQTNHMPDDITLDGLPESGNLSDAGGAVSVSGSESLNLSEINTLLGKNFPTTAAALKSIKDTYSYTGQVGALRAQLEAASAPQVQPAQANTALESTVKALQAQLDEQTFLAERPDYKDYLPTLRELRNSTGKSLAELTNSEAFKPLFEKSLAQDAAQKKRAVLDPTSRLGQVRDKMQEAKTFLKEGDVNKARETAVSNVLDAYNLHS